MQIAISVYQQQRGKLYSLTPVVPGLFGWSVSSGDLGKARQRLIERVRKELTGLDFRHFTRLHVPSGRRLTRQHLELTLRDDGEKQRVTGFFPVVVEGRRSHREHALGLAYHPLRPAAWFEQHNTEELSLAASRHFSRTFTADDNVELLRSNGSEKLVTLRFQVETPNLRRLLKSEKKADERASSGRSGDLHALLRVAVNQTARAAAGELRLGLPREPERERLRQLLCGPSKLPVLVVGPPGCGKSTLIAQAVQDLLDADDFAAHGNLDRVHNVLSMGGRQIIAGMSYVGQWEARCVELLERAKKRKLLLWIDDLPAFASIGKTTVSDRTLADFFQGPLARRDLVVIGECSSEQLSLLQHEAPSFAATFSIVQLEPATTADTLSMLLFESRQLEQTLDIAFDPRAFQAIVEQSSALSSGTVLPGRALTPLKAIAKNQAREEGSEPGDMVDVGVDQVLKAFSSQTGLPQLLLSPRDSLLRASLKSELAQQIVGQGVALEAACDLILSLRTKLCGPGRPYGVFLFTGPTGTGKTELAKCLAEYLYGAPERLVRFDMGELGTGDAVARLIGDQLDPDGLLTSRVRAQPFCVLLFDEVEKAHPSVLNLMLQIFEDARLGDARGNVTDFSHSVIVMTSNLGTARATVRGFADNSSTQSADIATAVREFFPPELFNRIDRVVPFAALDPQSARGIVKKELSLLVARPGLSERNTFVRFTDAVVARVVEDGYDARYGARALKRHIDREIGEALTRTIVSDAPAEMRLLWTFAESGGRGVGIRSEALREALPHPESSPLSDILASDYQGLHVRIPAALARLSGFEADGRLELLTHKLSSELALYRLGERGRASDIFTLDSLREHARGLSRRMEARLRSDGELEALERRRKLEQGDPLTELDFSALGGQHGQRFEPQRRFLPELSEMRSGGAGRARSLLEDLAEVMLLEGLLASASLPDRHVALIEVLKLSVHHERRRFSKGNPGLAEWLVEAYARARGELDEAAVLFWDGTTRRVPPSELSAALAERPQQVALRLVGPGVADFLRGESGCHVRRTLATGPEIVRVRVLPGHHEPLAWVERHRDALLAFERGLEGQGPLSDNPEQLLPVIRSLRFDPEPGAPSTLWLEDYQLSHVVSRRVRHIREVLAELWLLGAGLPELAPAAAPDPEVGS
jgi:ATP-dependent Clp protease ATP-binding subunit ClpC